MTKILFIGDIVGRIGRKTVCQILPKLKKEKGIDLVVANAENSAHGSGITERIVAELGEAGVDYFTSGDHALKRKSEASAYLLPNVLRPANFPPSKHSNGYCLIPIKNKNVLLVNLIGRVFMKADFDCPFRKIDEILANNNLPSNNIFAIIVDIHAEATSEKAALFHYLNGRVSALLGTHTHVMTADAQISDKGTAFISDVGMTGAKNSSIGIAKEGIIKTFLTQVKQVHVIPEKGETIFNSVLIEINDSTSGTKTFKPIVKNIVIN